MRSELTLENLVLEVPIRKSPTKNRSYTEGSSSITYSDEFFARPTFKADGEPQTGEAVIMLHSTDLMIKIFADKSQKKGYLPRVIANPGFEKSNSEYCNYLKELSPKIFRPSVFLLEANYGCRGGEAKFALIDFILEQIMPTYCMVISSTPECINSVRAKYGNKIIAIEPGASANKAFADLPNLSQPSTQNEPRRFSVF